MSDPYFFGDYIIEEVSSGEDMLVVCSGTDMVEMSKC